MYSRYYTANPSKEISIPKNYSGCAFTQQRRTGEEPRRYIEVAKPTVPSETPKEVLPLPLPTANEEREKDDVGEVGVTVQKALTAPPETPPPIQKRSGLYSLLDAFDTDQLLLLGLILLLLGNDGDSDLILYLGPLLLWH